MRTKVAKNLHHSHYNYYSSDSLCRYDSPHVSNSTRNYSDIVNKKTTHAHIELIIKTIKIKHVNEINDSKIKGAMKGDFNPKV